MKKAKVAELKNGLSRYLAYVKRGGAVLVFERDRPVARLVPAAGGASEPGDGRLAELERRGLIRRGSGGTARWIRRHAAVRVRGGVLKALLAERRSGW
jgi:antitoxin (DNA-binding transcriptional repressor) of toxin-antitoxin stability system